WAVLFGAAIGRWHARRGRIWLLAIASPLCLLGPTLALALFWKRARTTLARYLATGWRAIVQTTVCAPGRLMHLWRSLLQALARGAGRLTEPSFPLGAPTIASLIVAVLVSVAEFVVVFLAMLLWWVAATAGESAKERTFSAGDWWFVLGPPSVLSALTLTFFVVRWIPARRQASRRVVVRHGGLGLHVRISALLGSSRPCDPGRDWNPVVRDCTGTRPLDAGFPGRDWRAGTSAPLRIGRSNCCNLRLKFRAPGAAEATCPAAARPSPTGRGLPPPHPANAQLSPQPLVGELADAPALEVRGEDRRVEVLGAGTIHGAVEQEERLAIRRR